MQPQTFEDSQKVLLLFPSSSNKLLVSWQGPYEILERVGEVYYRIQVQGQRRCLYHVNLLMEWKERGDPGYYNVEIDWD